MKPFKELDGETIKNCIVLPLLVFVVLDCIAQKQLVPGMLFLWLSVTILVVQKLMKPWWNRRNGVSSKEYTKEETEQIVVDIKKHLASPLYTLVVKDLDGKVVAIINTNYQTIFDYRTID